MHHTRLPWLLAIGLAVASLGAAPRVLTVVDAARRGDAAAIRALLQAGANPNTAEADGTTLLHWTTRAGAVDATQVLIAAGAKPGAANRYGVTPLALAAANGSATLVELLVNAGADPNAASTDGETPLMIASRTGRADAVKVLLAHGARVDTVETWKGQTALMWAAAENHPEVVRALLEAGGAMQAQSKGGFTALLFAARNGATNALETLVAAGGSLTATTPDGTTPLIAAILNGHFATAMWMLDHGADPNAADPRGSALHVLAFLRKPGYPGSTGCCVLLPQGDPDTLALAKSLLAHGANPNVRIAWKEITFEEYSGAVRLPSDIRMGRTYISLVGATPFYVAAKGSDVPYMRLLLAHGADPHIATAQKVTPLIAAAGLGFWDSESAAPQNGSPESDTLEAVKLCVDLGADVNASTDFGDTAVVGDGAQLRRRHPFNLKQFPATALGDMRWNGSTALHGAALRGATTVISYLFERGARLDARNRVGWTPYVVAEGILVGNAERRWPQAAAHIRRLMEDKGLWTDAVASPIAQMR